MPGPGSKRCIRTRAISCAPEHWALELEPDASERLRIAAVLHDIERAFPDREATWDSARDWDSPAYNRWHQDRCADIASQLGCATRARPGSSWKASSG